MLVNFYLKNICKYFIINCINNLFMVKLNTDGGYYE